MAALDDKNLEEKLEKLGIKNILVADDKPENLSAAKEAFKGLKLEVDYVNSAASAIKKISEKAYDLVFTDLEMEEKDSGMKVVKEAIGRLTFTLVTTSYDGGHHGWSTYVKPLRDKEGNEIVVRSPKTDAYTWKEIIHNTLEYMNPYLFKAMKKVKGIGMTYNEDMGKTLSYMYKGM